MTMWNRIALSRDSPPCRPYRSLSLVLSAFLVMIALVSLMPSMALATRIPGTHGRIPGTVLPCYQKKTHRFAAEIQPSRCELAGTEGQQRKPTKIPIRGINWEFWGTYSSRGSNGVEVRTGLHVRVFAWRRVECRDGRIWYSSAVVFKPSNSQISVLRLRPCALSEPHG
jgi:hypothetical protein